jgi:hypothetical protein
MRSPSRQHPARIVTPLLADESSWSALEFAAGVAKAMHAELKGVFLEDAAALAAASLPFATTISFQSGRAGASNLAQLEAAYRARAAMARERVAALCRERAVTWSFEVAGRGAAIRRTITVAPTERPESVPPGQTAQRADEATELLLLDRRLLRRRQEAANLLRLATAYDTVGVWNTFAAAPDRVVLAYQGESETLTVALQLAAELRVPLEILVLEAGDGESRDLSAEVQDRLRQNPVAATVHSLSWADPEAVKAHLIRHSGALVLFGRKDLLEVLSGD